MIEVATFSKIWFSVKTEIAVAVKANCLEKASLEEARAEVNAKLGPCDILINGAGGNNPRATCDNEIMTPDTEVAKNFFDIDESGFKFVFDLNITSAFLVTQVFAEDMIQTGGNIINISSMNAYTPLTKIPAYSAAKAGVSNFTQWLAVHFAETGIRVNAIAPGVIKTDMLNCYSDADLKALADETPLGRLGKPEEIAAAVAFLASDDAAFITGQVLAPNGGMVI